MSVNVELLDEVIEYVKEHPEEWNQDSWAIGTGADAKVVDGKLIPGSSCGTTFCIAGTVAHLDPDANIMWQRHATGEIFANFVTVGGKEELISVYAQHKLGLSSGERDSLFYCGTDLENLYHIRDDIVNGAYRGE